MKVNECRLGNLILPKHNLDGEFIVVKKIDGDCINDYSPEANHYSGIPLTEEWLEKFGFKKTINIDDDRIEDWYYTIANSNFIILDNDCVGLFTFSDINIRVEIKFVHQLQNLFFALTGNELTLSICTN